MNDDEQKRLDQFEDSFGRVQGTVQDHAFKLSELEKKLDDVEAMTKHSHPALKLKGNQNFDDLRDVWERIEKLEKESNLTSRTRANLIQRIERQEDFSHDIDMLDKRIVLAYKNRKWIKKEISELKEWLSQHRKRIEKAFEYIDKNSKQLTFIQKREELNREVLRELCQRMGDAEDLCDLGYDLLKKLDGDSKPKDSRTFDIPDYTIKKSFIKDGDSDDYVDDYYDPNKEECEHNRPFWECEICGNVRKPKDGEKLVDTVSVGKNVEVETHQIATDSTPSEPKDLQNLEEICVKCGYPYFEHVGTGREWICPRKELDSTPSKPCESCEEYDICVYEFKDICDYCPNRLDIPYPGKEPTDLAGSTRQTDKEDIGWNCKLCGKTIYVDEYHTISKYHIECRDKYDLVSKADLEQMIDCCEDWFYNGIPTQSDIEDLKRWKKKYLEDADES